ncbi:MAG: hypothetical protein ABJV68_20665 [Paracoccaceae bacterium]
MLLFAMLPMTVNAQSVDEILDDANAQAEKIQNVLKVLQNGDQVTQFSLVEALLKNSNKALRRIGREHALFSTNPVLQNMAVESVFTENSQVRMVLENPSQPEVLKWLEVYGGAQDGQSGFVMMPVGNYDTAASCWADPVFKGCRFTVLGNSVQFRMFANGGQAINRASAALTLQPDGWLRGSFTSGYGPGQLSIDLKE